MSGLADAAAFLTQQWPVFACRADKRPATEHGFKDATRDPDEARAMFARPGAALIAVPTGPASDLLVVDLDVKETANGLEWLAANEHRLPRTRRHRTRSGGLHLLFRYPAGIRIGNSASKIAPGVDTRGDGGYVISPPSDGYTIADDAMPCPAPAWLLDLLKPPAPVTPPPMAPRVRTDGHGTPYGMRALDDECAAVCNAGFGSQESTLNAAGLKLGALAAGGELDPSYARQSLIRAALAMPSQGGREPWTPADVQRKAERAFSDGMGKPRQAPPREVRHVVRVEMHMPPEPPPWDEPPPHWHGEPETEAPEMPDQQATGAHFKPEQPTPKPALRFTDAAWDEANIPKRPWLIPGYCLRGSVTLYAGVGSAGKSSLMCATAIAACLGVAYGKLLPVKPLRVLTYNIEDDEDEQRRRFSAALRQFGRSPADIAGRIMRVGPENIGTLVEHDLMTGRFRMTQAWDELDALCAEWQPDLVMLDPLAELHTAEENNNTALRHVVALIRSLARKHNCGAILIHHFRKGGEAGDMDAIRGASAVVGAVRVALTVTPMSKEEADGFGISQDTRRQFFRVDNAKANYSAASEADWHALQGYEIDNGEDIAAAIPWTPPGVTKAAQTLAPDALALVAAEAARGAPSGPYSARLALDQPRSIATVMARNGITTAADQKKALAWLTTEARFVVTEWRDQDGDKRRGLRSPQGSPACNWVEGTSE